jgi:actin-related protein
VSKCPDAFTDELYKNIFVGGGNTAIPGFKQRVHTDLTSLKPNRIGDEEMRIFDVA